MKTVAYSGENFYEFVVRVKKECHNEGILRKNCVFNDVHFTVFRDSNPSDILMIYSLLLNSEQAESIKETLKQDS